MQYHIVDLLEILEAVDPGDRPAGLAGCRSTGTYSESCGYDMVLFDGSDKPAEVIPADGGFVVLHRGALDETRPDRLIGYHHMDILRDTSLELASFLSGLEARIRTAFTDCARNLLVDAIMCAGRAAEVSRPQGYAGSCWQKCASSSLADAVLALNHHAPSSHALGALRKIRTGADSWSIQVAAKSLDAERASATLLYRMAESAGIISRVIGGIPEDLIHTKTQAMVRDARLADCYHYLCGVSRDSILGAPRRFGTDSSLWETASRALDAERDTGMAEKNAGAVRKEAGRLLARLAGGGPDHPYVRAQN